MARVSSSKGALVAAVAVGISSLLSFATPAKADGVLFTTVDDFTGWSSGGTGSALYDYDGSLTNGAGNLTNPGGVGVPGSLQIPAFGRTSPGFSTLSSAPSEGGNATFLSAIDPGSSGNNSVAYTGNLSLTYTIPTPSAGSYYQLGVLLQYAADGYYGTFFAPAGNTVSDGTVDGFTTVTDTIPYTISAGNFNGFGFGIQANTDYAGTSGPIYVDSISVSSVPEPASLSLIGLSGLSLLGRRRK